jgi:hypothetical protein
MIVLAIEENVIGVDHERRNLYHDFINCRMAVPCGIDRAAVYGRRWAARGATDAR